ncbi:unnamed protein product [Victoria cruziana]
MTEGGECVDIACRSPVQFLGFLLLPVVFSTLGEPVNNQGEDLSNRWRGIQEGSGEMPEKTQGSHCGEKLCSHHASSGLKLYHSSTLCLKMLDSCTSCVCFVLATKIAS